MSRRSWDGYLRAGTALGLLVIASAQANAGGFAVREQSVYGQGSSFAGVAAGGALSSMFWNPATMTQFQGVVSETDVSGLFPSSSNTPVAGTLVSAGFPGTSNVANAAAVPAGYTSYQLSPSLWLGMSLNAPFGLSVSPPDFWAGRGYAGQTLLKTYNAAPSIAWRINDWISVGAGVQIQYAKASLERGIGGTLGLQATLEGKGWAYGATAGVTLTPTPTTTIGLGWRSALNQKIDGALVATSSLPGSTFGSVTTTVDLPDIVSLGIRQVVDPRWTLLGTVEWSNWSRIGTATVSQLNGQPATILNGFGGGAVTIPFQYRDGWFFSGGAEYIWNERLTVRGGLGYEISPITDQVRTPLVPDNDRFWASVGATWQVIKGVHFDVAYSHVWVKDTSVNISATSGNPFYNGVTYIGNVDNHVDILSVALVIRMDDLEPTLKRAYMK
ncbi:MAG TPA: OmpP1/FadL family transporter [Pseudolabrys sp.]|nr:OmpP1/FadL family transporter [Pseudolabrys sp.]